MKIPPAITEQVAPLGPEAMAMLEGRRNCVHQFGGVGVCVLCGESACRHVPRPSRTTAQLTADIAAGIRVLVTRDGVELTEAQVLERAANIVAGLIGNYNITAAGE
jgi:hypothetical protein